jgi:hypothetical protein
VIKPQRIVCDPLDILESAGVERTKRKLRKLTAKQAEGQADEH